jgi:hypothetical protein
MHFKKEEICRLIRACAYYQDATGSEYMYDKYQELIQKLTYFGEDVLPEPLSCTNIE